MLTYWSTSDPQIGAALKSFFQVWMMTSHIGTDEVPYQLTSALHTLAPLGTTGSWNKVTHRWAAGAGKRGWSLNRDPNDPPLPLLL